MERLLISSGSRSLPFCSYAVHLPFTRDPSLHSARSPSSRETADLQFARDDSGRKMINQYVILREIGRGQHGQVRLGQDISTPEHSRAGSSVAIPHSRSGAGAGGSTSRGMTGDVREGMGQGSFWAIKIVDRQPKRRLPAVRRGGRSGLGAGGDGSQHPSSLANAKYVPEGNGWEESADLLWVG